MLSLSKRYTFLLPEPIAMYSPSAEIETLVTPPLPQIVTVEILKMNMNTHHIIEFGAPVMIGDLLLVMLP